MRFIAMPVITVDLTSDYTSKAIDITHMNGYEWTVDWTDGGALAGAFKIQVSPNAYATWKDAPRDADGIALEDPDAVWVDLPDSTKAVTLSAAYMWNVDAPYYTGTRLVYTASAGVGSTDIYFTAHGVL